MEKLLFQDYCNEMKLMAEGYPHWRESVAGSVADCLRKNIRYGFPRVLCELLAPAYDVVQGLMKKPSEDRDLYEAASLLSASAPIESYRFSAYLFAVSVAAVAFGGVEADEVDCEGFDENELFQFDVSLTMLAEADGTKKRLKKFGVRLLDVSRSNQLVHFRPTKNGTLALHCADVYAAMRHVIKGKKASLCGWKHLAPKTVYRCKLCGRLEYGPYDGSAKKTQGAQPCPVCDATNTHNRRSLQPLKERLCVLPRRYVCACGKELWAEELEKSLRCPYCAASFQSDRYPLVTESALKKYAVSEMVCGVGDTAAKDTAKSLMNKAKSVERNFGLHVLYLVCGFLKWKDSAGTEYNSPLLLCPINLSLDRQRGQFSFEVDPSANGKFELNRTLVQMLAGYSSTCSIVLPQPNEMNINGYFSLLKQALASANDAVAELTRTWEISTEMGIGLFQYQKLQLHHDLEQYGDKYLAHPIVRRLCGDTDAALQASTSQRRHSLEYMLLDADSSQEEVIKAAQEGRSFILQGPPGSGKSQTITNVIASALGEGKTVLFVTEKASARSVILDNLTRCGGEGYRLSDFVLDFDSFRTRGGAIGRDPFVGELNRCLTAYVPRGSYEDKWLAEEQVNHDRVQEFMRQSRGEFGGRSYMRLLQDVAPYAAVEELVLRGKLPVDWVEFAELRDALSRFYTAREACGAPLDYKLDALYGCSGDRSGALLKAAQDYRENAAELTDILTTLEKWGWTVTRNEGAVRACLDELRLWRRMPRLPEEVAAGFDPRKSEKLITRIATRVGQLKEYEAHPGVRYQNAVNEKALATVNLSELSALISEYRSFFKRLGRGYRELRARVAACLTVPPARLAYKELVNALDVLREYKAYLELRSAWENGREVDRITFGASPDSEAEWEALRQKLASAARVLEARKKELIPQYALSEWLTSFGDRSWSMRMAELAELESRLAFAAQEERRLAKALEGYFDAKAFTKSVYPERDHLAGRVLAEADRLERWRGLTEVLEYIQAKGWEQVLESVLGESASYADVEKRLYKAYYKKSITAFINANGLTALRNFTRLSHERLIGEYAEADKRVLASGARRLYERLKGYLKVAAGVVDFSGALPRIQQRTGYSIKRTIAENWAYVKAIKPCFMMSPLNVSQYVDIDLTFDLVIFDEASQIFTEDALAAISRGGQIIIAGDSKQLPPCDFFRAGDSVQDDEEQYFEDEANKELSLLVAADEALSDASVALAWHYRSCDEALVAFANEQMDYNLITFPSAKREENDGVYYVPIAYSPDTCYVAGKGGSHVNPGEADAIVKLIYEEMTHPDRSRFSIGVVAFSNAQAAEIEARWEAFKLSGGRRAEIERWEQLHEDEPLIFCNLDTVQGDERDTTILSICYSPDANGRFTLPYLGRIRLLSGKKRINVAVTRARHRMLVVSTLDSHTLKTAIKKSTAPEENKAGAEMLCALLEYAQGFMGERKLVCRPSDDPFVRSVCEVLDEAGIGYETEIGRSECRVSIGIKSPGREGDFALGIILDDPARPDFDSVREYTRLTEQVLTKKYGWTLYRVYPTAWLRNYETEKKLLLDKVYAALRDVENE